MSSRHLPLRKVQCSPQIKCQEVTTVAFKICAIYKLSNVKISKTGHSFNFFVGETMPKMEKNKYQDGLQPNKHVTCDDVSIRLLWFNTYQFVPTRTH